MRFNELVQKLKKGGWKWKIIIKGAGFHGLWIAGIIISIAGFATGYPLIGGVALAMLLIIIFGWLGARGK